MALKTYIFQVEDGFSIDGKGGNPRIAFQYAKHQLQRIQNLNKNSYLAGKNLTGRYNTYDKDGFVQTGSFPKSIKKR